MHNGKHKVKVGFILLLLVNALPAFAQFSYPAASSAGKSQSFPFMTPGSARRFCTPAEYGDPMADCIPPQTGLTSGAPSGNPEMGGNPWLGLTPELRQFGTTDEINRDAYNSGAAHPNRAAYVEREPETEFQKYVASSIGQILPIFGASLFERVPTTFAPLDQVPVSADYVIAPGDELQVAVWGQFNFSRRLIVNRTGEVTLPEGGPVAVSGMQHGQAATVLKSVLARYYKNFDVSVTLGRLHSIQVFVVGEARRPGSYTVSSLSTMVNAIFASGGPSSRGSMRQIELRRGDCLIRQFDLYDLLLNGDKSKDGSLAPGDVILITAAGPRVAVAGSVERPGIYELKANTTLGDALKLADGPSALAAGKELLLERVVDGSALQVTRIPLDSAGLQTPLRNGDIARVLPVVRKFENAVTLRGNVADPGRFPWHEGMRLSDLIPNKESLLTRDYWRERNSFGSGEGMDADPRHSAAADFDVKTPINGTSTQGTQERARPEQLAYMERKLDTQADTSFGAATTAQNTLAIRSFLPRNVLQPVAPEINWEYAVVERLDEKTLATRILPFNLGNLVNENDSSQNLLLRPGDTVTIFSKADYSIPRQQQPNQVRLEGEIAMAGTYTVLPGETLRQLIARAGGLTHNAYLYGAQFTRESTRREQQKRYDDFLNQFDREVTEAASSLSNRVISVQQAATAQSTIASQRELLERLRKVSMNGRIVLDMAPDSRGLQALPDLPLENGDRLYVPSRPLTVNVIGNVFEQAAFLHEEDLRVADYLKKAGGPARAADVSHMFVIRADGSVVSRKAAGSVFFAKSFDTLRLYPGDTVVVPTYINRTSFIRNLTDWSQVFSNLALGAAAMNVLR